MYRTILLTALAVTVLAQSPALGDACANVADDCLTPPNYTAVDHVGHSGYSCTAADTNHRNDDWDDVKTVDKVWNEGDVNCGCLTADADYTTSRARTNTNTASIDASYSGSVSATAGVSLAGSCKTEATATASWTAGAGWGTETTDEETLTASSGFTALKCSEWSYKKWYYVGTVTGQADLYLYWSDYLTCEGDLPHGGNKTESNAITASGRGWELYDGQYDGQGPGFQNWDVRCEKCGTITSCYKGECPGDCASDDCRE